MHVTVAREAGGFYDTVVLLDRKKIAAVGETIDVEEKVVRRPDAEIGSTIAADLDVFRRGVKTASYRLRGDRIHYGANLEYEAKLKSDQFYRHLRELVRDPLK